MSWQILPQDYFSLSWMPSILSETAIRIPFLTARDLIQHEIILDSIFYSLSYQTVRLSHFEVKCQA